MNTKIIGIVILAVAIGGSSAYFLTKDDSLDTNSTSNKPIYQKSAAYGHFGRDPGSDGSFSWEKTDKADIFKK